MSRLILLAVIAASGGDRYYATEEYCTRAADTPANTLFTGRLVDAIYERAVSFPVWDRAGGGQAISYLELVNVDGALDSWLTDDWKDVRITLKVVEQRAAYSTATQVGVCVIDRLEAPSRDRIRFVCRSAFERLEKVITQTYSNAVTNEAVRGNPQPITLGRVRWLDPVNRTLNDTTGSTRAVYDVADGFFEDITQLYERGALENESNTPLVTNTSPTYFIAQDSNGYGFLFREQTGRLAAEIRGQIRREANIANAPTFPTGSGNPDNWDVTEGGSGAVTWVSAGVVTIYGDGTAPTNITQDTTLASGKVYQLVVHGSTGGVLSLYYGGTIIRSVENVVSGTIVASFIAQAGVDGIGVGYPAGASGTSTINAVYLYPANRIDTLAEVIRFAGVTRGNLSTGDIDSTALAAIDTATGYAIGWHSNGGEVRGIDLANLATQSFGVAIFQDGSGKLAPVQIDTPAVSADFALDELDILDITWEADTAPGLSTRMYYGRNYAPHSDDDVALVSVATPAGALFASQLKQEVLTVTTTETLDAIYADAADREPLESILSEQADAQAEIDRLCALYTVPRAFYTIKAFVESGTTHTIEPGATVEVTHSRYGLSAGVNLLVVAARSDFLGNAVDLVLWG